LLVIEEWTLSSTPKVETGETLINSYTSEITGRRTHYLATGVGAPVVLLHGNGDSARVWRQTLQALAGTYRLYAPDLPGFGESEPPAAYTPSAYARFVTAFLDHIGSGLAVARTQAGLFQHDIWRLDRLPQVTIPTLVFRAYSTGRCHYSRHGRRSNVCRAAPW